MFRKVIMDFDRGDAMGKSSKFVTLVVLGLSVVLYQNCAPMAPQSQGLQTSSSTNVDSDVDWGQVPDPNSGGGGSGSDPITLPSGGTPSNALPDPTVTGRKLVVCPSGCPYSLPSAALAAAIDGDTIEIQYANYTDCGYVNKNNLIIRGVLNGTARPHIQNKTCGRKGILVIQGKNILLENLELSGARDMSFGDNNWAGIRYDTIATAANLKIRNLYIHDNDNGILGGGSNSDPDNALVVENSIFTKMGRTGYEHGMYIGEGTKLFVFRNSVVFDNAYDGHLIKSRAQQNLIECSTIASLDGANSFAMDFPQGGRVFINNNVVHQGPNINNTSNFFVKYAGENTKNSPHRVQVTGNTFVNEFSGQGRISLLTAADTSGWAGNKYIGNGAGMALVGYSGASSFTNFATRTAAGLPVYDATLASLPSPPACP